ncbi:DMT family transporter [Lederbergia citrea]|uniref:DMT family transporter n=1 Tax=Lederbergia citrea TaxID=2833581 RepID=UPI001BC93544|nr:DMT family transporter [Lederbergia citrea]MBS4203647.1 DMT family transporter [Lederbergia citrea]
MGILFALLTGVTTAFFNIFIKKGMDQSQGKSIGFVITIFVNVVIHSLIFIVVIMLNGFTFQFNWTATVWFMVGGIFSTIIGRYALLSAIQSIHPSRASALKNITPVFTVLYALLILQEDFSLLSIIGLLILFVVIFMQGVFSFRQSRLALHKDKYDKSEWRGYLMGVIAAFIFGLGQGVRKQGLLISSEPIYGALIGLLIAFIVIVLYQGFKGSLKTIILENYRIININFILASVFLSFGPVFFFIAASLIQVSYVSVIAAVEPLITILLSIFFLKGREKLTPSVWIGAFLILVGITFISLDN